MRLKQIFNRMALLGILFFFLLPLGALSAQEDGASSPRADGLKQRIDFGNTHILGQSIKSGAVYLMHRKKSDIHNMLEVRNDYREEIKEDFNLEQTAIIEHNSEAPKPENNSR